MERVIGFGIRESQARAVYASVRGLKAVADRLGVCESLASRWARELGVELLPRLPGRPELHRVSDDQVLAAILSPRSLTQAAYHLGISGPGLLKRARSMGLPTDPPSRAAFRASRRRSRRVA